MLNITLVDVFTNFFWRNLLKLFMIYNNELEKQNIDYGDFDIINQMKTSKFWFYKEDRSTSQLCSTALL